ncbi:diphthine--ammonia ligase [Pedobacter frigidisoli]|uniref:Dph6-related ATP pyrophosphatase n=1 Tax=Pedobacter frigidisoli TaxID=2530455 RepID=UPI00292F07F9|nr:diphthine--ammonia ligase [Pedobacter frigidisoli]
MAVKKRCIFNWSGGKDSTLALHYALEDPTIEICYLVTTLTAEFNRISMHGVRESLLIKQAESIGIPLYQIRLSEMPTMEHYDETMGMHLAKLKAEGITHSIFGDIHLEDLRAYREKKLEEIGLKAIFPLWKMDTRLLIQEFLNLNYKTIMVCTQQNLEMVCGEVITLDLIDNLPPEIDPCGENGEFHTFAFQGPIFRKKIEFELGEKIFKTYRAPVNTDPKNEEAKDSTSISGFWFIDLKN